jgi:hypothetical protein
MKLLLRSRSTPRPRDLRRWLEGVLTLVLIAAGVLLVVLH